MIGLGVRIGGNRVIKKRFFTSLLPSDSRYFAIPSITLSNDYEIGFDARLENLTSGVIGRASDVVDRILIFGGKFRWAQGNVNLIFSELVIFDGQLHNYKFKKVGDVFSWYQDDIFIESITSPTAAANPFTVDALGVTNSSNFINGILANVYFIDAGTLVRNYPISENYAVDFVIKDTANNENGLAVNITTADANAFSLTQNGWEGDEVIINGNFNSATGWVLTESPPNSEANIAGNKLNIISTDGTTVAQATQSPLVAFHQYILRATATLNSGAEGVKILFGGKERYVIKSVDNFIVSSDLTTTLDFEIINQGIIDIDINNISVKQIIKTPKQKIHVLGDSFVARYGNPTRYDGIYKHVSEFINGRKYQFTSDGVGGATLAEHKIRFDATPEFYDDTLIIMDGGMDDTAAAAITAIDGIVAHLSHNRWVYVQPSPREDKIAGTPDRLDWDNRLNLIIAHVGPGHYVEIMPALQLANDGSVDDLIDVANNIVPRSLRVDAIHEGSKGTQIRAKLVQNFIENNIYSYEITPNFSVYLDDNSKEPINTGNIIDFIGLNLAYGELQERITLQKSFYISWSKTYVNNSLILGSKSDTTWLQYRSESGVRGVTLRMQGNEWIGYGAGVVPQSDDISTIVYTDDEIKLYLNGDLMNVTPILYTVKPIDIDYLNRRESGSMGTGAMGFLDINGLPFKFTEGAYTKLHSVRVPLVRIMLAGQSNAVSDNIFTDGNPDNLPEIYPTSYKYRADGSRHQLASDVNAYDGTGTGYGVEFRVTNDLEASNRHTEFIKYCAGSTGASIGEWWYYLDGAGTQGLIDTAINSGAQMDYLIWIQGENDATTQVAADAYESNITNLFARFRAEINPNLKIILVRLFDFTAGNQVYATTIQTAQDNVAASDLGTYILNPAVDAGILETELNPDGIHYNPVAIDKLGICIAQKIAQIGFNNINETFEIDLFNTPWVLGQSYNAQTSLINYNQYLIPPGNVDGTGGVVIPQDDLTPGVDLLGNEITRQKLINGYNFTGQLNHFLNTQKLNYTSGAGFTFQLWFRPATAILQQNLGGDDKSIITTDSSGFISWVYNGTTITGTTKPSDAPGDWVHVVLRSLGTGTGEILTGTEITRPISEIDAAIGIAAPSINVFKIGNIDGLGNNCNGYITQLIFHSEYLTSNQILNDWDVTRKLLN